MSQTQILCLTFKDDIPRDCVIWALFLPPNFDKIATFSSPLRKQFISTGSPCNSWISGEMKVHAANYKYPFHVFGSSRGSLRKGSMGSWKPINFGKELSKIQNFENYPWILTIPRNCKSQETINLNSLQSPCLDIP